MKDYNLLKYLLAATALRLFSSTSITKKLYRTLGNYYGTKRRSMEQMPEYYVQRVKYMLKLINHNHIINDGDKIAELGTGWLHWDAFTLALFFNVEGALFDIWDNRQLSGLQNYISQLELRLNGLDIENFRRKRAFQLITCIKKVKTYEELYDILGFIYIIDESGKLNKLNNSSYNVVLSSGVLEHIDLNILSEYVKNISDILKPGGYSVHSINIRDHLHDYDKKTSSKQYLKYSDKTWKHWFDNEVQYINRKQHSDWLSLFDKVGLKLIAEEIVNTDLNGLIISKDYKNYKIRDLNCAQLNIVHRKPNHSYCKPTII